MIVVDTNVIAYLFVQGVRTTEAEDILSKDSDWIAPYLWRSEFRNVLALYVRQALISLKDANILVREAEALMNGKEYEVSSEKVLQLADASKCSAYDCEFVSLAEQLGVELVTTDKKILTAFPNTAVSMERFAAG